MKTISYFCGRAALLLTIVGATFVTPNVARSADEVLGIRPALQETQVWCWAAVSEMVYRHYRVPNANPYGDFQCGIVGLLFPACSTGCTQSGCVFSAGTMANMADSLRRYPSTVRRLGGRAPRISAKVHYCELSKSRLRAEIDNKHPVVVGISPLNPSGVAPSAPQHVALIVGYRDNGNVLIVNDPFPFHRSNPDPYALAGANMLQPLQYEIAYDDLKSELNWTQTITIRARTRSSFDIGGPVTNPLADNDASSGDFPNDSACTAAAISGADDANDSDGPITNPLR